MYYISLIKVVFLTANIYIIISNEIEQLMDFEEHNYLFDHLTAIPSASIVYDSPLKPTCVTVDPSTEQIYVGEQFYKSTRVFIFSESGNIVKQFIQKGLCYPKGMAIHQDNLYLTLLEKTFLVHFKVADDLHLIRSKEDIGSTVDKFKQLRRLAVSNNGDVFVTDYSRHRVQILDGDLNYKRQISHYSMVHPCDVKLNADEVFVLSFNPLHSRYCILVFNQKGFKLRSIILRGLSQPVFEISRWAFHYPVFCLDSYGNLIINDVNTDEVKFFTKEGALFQKLGDSGPGPGMFMYITGLTLTANHKLIVVSMFGDFKLQIFSCF